MGEEMRAGLICPYCAFKAVPKNVLFLCYHHIKLDLSLILIQKICFRLEEKNGLTPLKVIPSFILSE